MNHQSITFVNGCWLFVLSSVLLLSEAKPTSDEECTISSYYVRCNGDKITNFSLENLRHRLQQIEYQDINFYELIISETLVTNIGNGLFASVNFSSVNIEGNHYLGTIDPDAFRSHQVQQLLVINNPVLAKNNVYELIDQLQVQVEVCIEFNSLKEIPSNAFSNRTLKSQLHQNLQIPHTIPANNNFAKLVLSNNKIEQIRSNAFHSMFHRCKEIYLNYNPLNWIDSYGFNLSTTSDERPIDFIPTTVSHIHIYLDHNHLVSESFQPNFVYFPATNNQLSVILNLSYNRITKLNETIFKPLIENPMFNSLELAGNKLECDDPSMHWLTNNRQYSNKIIGLKCV